MDYEVGKIYSKFRERGIYKNLEDCIHAQNPFGIIDEIDTILILYIEIYSGQFFAKILTNDLICGWIWLRNGTLCVNSQQ